MVKPCLSCEDQFEPASGLNYAKHLRMRQASSADTFPTSSDSPGLTKGSFLPSHTVAESTDLGWRVPCRIRVVSGPGPERSPPSDRGAPPVAGPILAHLPAGKETWKCHNCAKGQHDHALGTTQPLVRAAMGRTRGTR
jgi:hypothetical protein